MADGLLTTTSGYNPFSFLELWTPAAEATKAHLAALEQYDELLTNTAILESLANTDPNSEAYKQYRNYYENLQRTANELGQLGLSPKVYSLISNMRKLYGQDIIPVLEALKKRTEFYKRIKDLQDRDESVIFDLENPQLVSIDLFTKGEVPLVYASGDKARDLGVAMGSSVSLRIHTFGQKYGLDLIYLTEATGTPTRDILVQLANSNRPEAADAAALVEELNSMIGEFQGSNAYLAMGDRGRTELMNKLNLGIDIGWKYDIRLDYRNRPLQVTKGYDPTAAIKLAELKSLVLPIIEKSELLKNLDSMGTGLTAHIIKGDSNGYLIDIEEWNKTGLKSGKTIAQIALDLMLSGIKNDITESTITEARLEKPFAPNLIWGSGDSTSNTYKVADHTLNGMTYDISGEEYEKAMKLIDIIKADEDAYAILTDTDIKNYGKRAQVNLRNVVNNIIDLVNKGTFDKGALEYFLDVTPGNDRTVLNEKLAILSDKDKKKTVLFEWGWDDKTRTYKKGKPVTDYNTKKEHPVSVHWLADRGTGDSYLAVTVSDEEGNTRKLLVPSAGISSDLPKKQLITNEVYQSFNKLKNKQVGDTIVGTFPLDLGGLADKKKLTVMDRIALKLRDNIPLTKEEAELYNRYTILESAAATQYTVFSGEILGLATRTSGTSRNEY